MNKDKEPLSKDEQLKIRIEHLRIQWKNWDVDDKWEYVADPLMRDYFVKRYIDEKRYDIGENPFSENPYELNLFENVLNDLTDTIGYDMNEEEINGILNTSFGGLLYTNCKQNKCKECNPPEDPLKGIRTEF